MNTSDISKAKNPDLRAALAALQRAAEAAREVAVQTNTGIVLTENGKLLKVSAQELQAQRSKP